MALATPHLLYPAIAANKIFPTYLYFVTLYNILFSVVVVYFITINDNCLDSSV